ncbi:MAG: P-type conjugative transfer protein TrbG [Robiginitomaculum sp.]|nr:MAG: P-type conjugative transfer protein TrbG [Robiginitomaculum sp.]
MKRFITLALLTTSLTACSTFNNVFHKTQDDFVLDEGEFTQAVLAFEEEPQHITVINQIDPLTMAGQLKPLNTYVSANTTLSPSAAILQAHANALVRPSADNYVNAIQIYPYSMGALYQVYCAPKQVTDIVLQAGEVLTSVSAGDTVQWVLGDTVSGSGSGEQVHIFVKPIAADISTNLVITTDRRTYHLEMSSFRKTYMAAVSWRYPNEHFGRTRIQKSALRGASNPYGYLKPHSNIIPANDNQGLQLANLKFRYEIKGDNPHWRPITAFDDGSKVFIQFPNRLDQGEAPPLFVVGTDGKSQLVNYRVKGTYYVVDRLFAVAELRLGEKKQAVVRIVRMGNGKSKKPERIADVDITDLLSPAISSAVTLPIAATMTALP